jgi:Tfp pilus assembly protein PilO
MSETTGWARTKTIITVALAILIAADIGVGVFFWRTSQQKPAEMRAELDHLRLEAKLREADVRRAEKIRASLPEVGKDCDNFYQSAFLDGSSGYSSVDADLSSIADKVGLRISDTTYKKSDASKNGVQEVAISTTVEGNYAAVIQFISGLEQSKNFYLLNDLSLTSAKAGAIQLQLKLRTFFRA